MLALVAIGLLVYFCVMATACAVGLTDPRPASCSNALEPAAFRPVLDNGDTLSAITNHFLEPRRSADTTFVRFSDGRIARRIDRYAGDYCITALDSALRHTQRISSVVGLSGR